MKPWKELTHFAGLDWATDHHDVAILDRDGKRIDAFRFEHTAEGWAEFRQRIKPCPALAIAIETSQGPAVERLLDAGLTVYPVNPKNAERYRERHVSSGAKSDTIDAWSLADALRVDGHGWRALQPDEPITQQLRLLCRDEVALIQQRTALVNQLRAALREYYPAALEAFDDWTRSFTWAFVEAFPTPEALQAAGRRKWEKFLHARKLYRPKLQEKRLEIFARATEFCGAPAVTAAKSLLAVSLARMLRTLQSQLDAFRDRIEALFAKHPDHDIFGSLPNGGAKMAPRLLSEMGDQRDRFGNANNLQCYAGTAPVTRQTGRRTKGRVLLRRACNKSLRCALHLWADLSRKKSPWAQAYYRAHRERGRSHADAVRRLGNRWLKIIWKMWQTRTPYDPELHQRNQILHGSWVLQIKTAQKD